jgi:hypothetical protein
MNEEQEIIVVEAWHARFWGRYRSYFSRKEFNRAVILSAAAFIAGIIANGYAVTYATERASNPVTDIILSNTPVFDVDALAVYGMVAFIIFVVVLCLQQPRRIPFMLYSVGLFFAVRAIFISLTHLGPFPIHTAIQFTGNISIFLSQVLIGGDDLFFSAHTGFPFLMALLFWNQKALRYFFIACSVFFGIVMLLGHLHYSIDVLSAFFITYGTYKIALWLFPREQALFLAGE